MEELSKIIVCCCDQKLVDDSDLKILQAEFASRLAKEDSEIKEQGILSQATFSLINPNFKLDEEQARAHMEKISKSANL